MKRKYKVAMILVVSRTAAVEVEAESEADAKLAAMRIVESDPRTAKYEESSADLWRGEVKGIQVLP